MFRKSEWKISNARGRAARRAIRPQELKIAPSLGRFGAPGALSFLGTKSSRKNSCARQWVHQWVLQKVSFKQKNVVKISTPDKGVLQK